MGNEYAISIQQDQAQSMALNVTSELPVIFTLAKALINAGGFLPMHLKTEGEIVAVVLAGRELGITPMAAIRSIKLVKGNVTLDASLQLALMIRAGCKFRWLESDDQKAAIELTRPGQDPYVSRFSIVDAKRAGLLKEGGNWAMYPQAMLRARCISAAGKAYCPDILAGVYTPDELPTTDTYHRAQAEIEHAAEASEDEWNEERRAATEQIACSAQQGEPTKEQRLDVLLVQRLPCATKEEDFVALARELIELHGPVRGSKGWKMFMEACAAHEVSPRQVVDLASKPAEEQAAQ